MLGSRRREELRRQRDFDSTVIGRVKALLQVNIDGFFLFECLMCIRIKLIPGFVLVELSCFFFLLPLIPSIDSI